MKPALLLLCLFATAALGATGEPAVDPGDDFSPMLFVFALVGLCIMLFLAVVGMVAAVIVAVSAAVLTVLGVVSSAAFVGLLRRRFSSGLRAFHYQVCAVAALPAGIGVLWLGSHLFNTHLRQLDILAVGSIAGACGGLLLALAFDCLAGLAYRRLVAPLITHAAERA